LVIAARYLLRVADDWRTRSWGPPLLRLRPQLGEAGRSKVAVEG
jgi:hypothetical protein